MQVTAGQVGLLSNTANFKTAKLTVKRNLRAVADIQGVQGVH